MVTVPVYDGLALQPGNRLPGPAIVEQPTTTIVLPGDTGLSCDQWGNYLLEKADIWGQSKNTVN